MRNFQRPGERHTGMRITLALVCVCACLAFPLPAQGQARAEKKVLLREDRVEKMLAFATKLLGVEYQFGAASDRDDAVDCSSLVQKAFKDVGVTLPRTAYGQSRNGLEVEFSALRRGDRLYFKMTDRDVPIDHTALYLGDGNMLHAFPGKGVCVEPLDDYRTVLTSARR